MAVIGLVTSCITPFDPQYDESPLIYIESFPGASPDYIDIKIMPAYSKSNTPVMPAFKTDVTFVVNGKETPVECIDTEEGWYRAYYSSQPGDKMNITVISDGFDSVYAETAIPDPFPKRRIDYRKVEKEKRATPSLSFSYRQPFGCKLLCRLVLGCDNLNTLVEATSLAYTVSKIVLAALRALHEVGGVLELPNARTSLHLSRMRNLFLRYCHC